MSFRKGRPVRAEHPRKVGKERRGRPESLIDPHLDGGVRQVIVPPQHVGDLHGEVVQDDGKVVGGPLVAPHEHRVGGLSRGEIHLPSEQVRHDGEVRDPQPQRGSLAPLQTAPDLRAREAGAMAQVARRLSLDHKPPPILLQPLRGAEARVGGPGLHQPSRLLLVVRRSLRLAVRPIWATGVGPFVPVQPEPVQVFQQPLLGSLDFPLDVRVLDAKDENALVVAREQPVEQGRPRVAQVQGTGGRRSEANAHAGHLTFFLASLVPPSLLQPCSPRPVPGHGGGARQRGRRFPRPVLRRPAPPPISP